MISHHSILLLSNLMEDTSSFHLTTQLNDHTELIIVTCLITFHTTTDLEPIPLTSAFYTSSTFLIFTYLPLSFFSPSNLQNTNLISSNYPLPQVSGHYWRKNHSQENQHLLPKLSWMLDNSDNAIIFFQAFFLPFSKTMISKLLYSPQPSDEPSLFFTAGR